MKKFILSTLVAMSVGSAFGSIYTVSSGTLNQVIPDGNVNGIFNTLNVSGAGTSIESITVTLNVSGGYNGDLYAYLSFGGNQAILLNRVGRTSSGDISTYGDTGFAVTLSATGNDIHNYQNFAYSLNGNGQLTGNWQADGRDINPATVVNTDSRLAGLGGFDGMNPNGAWTLFFADMSASGDPSTLQSWSLEISTVPEPVNVALGVLGGAGIVAHLVARFRRRNSTRKRVTLALISRA